METKGLWIIIPVVFLMMVGMMFLVNDFKEADQVRKSQEKIKSDSIINEKFNQLMEMDSLMLLQMEDQKAKTEQLKLQINSVKNKLNSLSE